LAERKTIAIEALDGAEMVSFDEDLSIRREIDRVLSQHGVTVDVKLAFDNVETIKRAVSDQLSLRVAEVVLLKAGQLPKTSSGKLQRRKTREQFLAGTLGDEGVRTLGTGGETLNVAKHIGRSLLGRVSHLASGVLGLQK